MRYLHYLSYQMHYLHYLSYQMAIHVDNLLSYFHLYDALATVAID
jgi:hypothetical protein